MESFTQALFTHLKAVTETYKTLVLKNTEPNKSQRHALTCCTAVAAALDFLFTVFTVKIVFTGRTRIHCKEISASIKSSSSFEFHTLSQRNV